MGVRIDPALRERFAALMEAASRPSTSALTALARGTRSVRGIDAARVARSCRAPVVSETDVKRVYALAREDVPRPLWPLIIVACKSAVHVEGAIDALTRQGFEIDERPQMRQYLKPLGMLALVMPPNAALLDQAARVEAVEILADGDERLAVPAPLSQEEQTPAGPLQALVMTMLGGEDLPDDLNKVRDGAARVAILDTGIDGEHPAFTGRIEKHVDLSGGELGPVDPVGHGTHVGGIVAGLPPGGLYALTGVAPFAHLVDIQVWGHEGILTGTLLQGIGCAMQERVDVLNVSLGAALRTDGTSIITRAIQKAAETGLICCVSAGNEGASGGNTLTIPADARDAIAVAAIGLDGKWARFSSQGPSDDPAVTGPKPTVATPGVGIVAPRSQASEQAPFDRGGRYVSMSGTSMASPMAAGVCALGVGYLRGVFGEDADTGAILAALTATAGDPHKEGPNKVGRGIPRVPAFLRVLRHAHQARCTIAAAPPLRQTTERVAKQLGVDGFAQADGVGVASGASPASGGVVDMKIIGQDEGRAPDAEEARALFKRYRDIEAAYLEGVRANVARFAGQLAQELAGRDSVRAGGSFALNERQRLMDDALLLRLDEGARMCLPENGEWWWVFNHRGLLRTQPALVVGVKSLAGAQALTRARPSGRISVGEYIARFYMQVPARLARLQLEGRTPPPIALAVLAPSPWRGEEHDAALAGPAAVVVVTHKAPGGDEKSPWQTAPGTFNWNAWLALTPATLETRLEHYRDRLKQHPALLVAGDSEYVWKLAQEFGLPKTVTRELIAAAGRLDGLFEITRAADGEERVRRTRWDT
ncbi:MAG: S8 family serine peptidase [Candidatus Hydrogenedentes bacterium]|nr:S8 family serine peptidase [Candidatus Hydrogenedentota bacterium]